MSLAGCTTLIEDDDSSNSGTGGGNGTDTPGSSDPTGYKPMFRNDIFRTGYFPDASVPDAVKLDWEIDGINKWTHTAAKGSPTVVDDTVYVGGDTGALYSITLDGEMNWGVATHPSANGIHGTPAVEGDVVYIGAYDGAMYAYDRGNGDLLWRTDIAGSIGSSPAYYKGNIYVSVETPKPSGVMAVLDAETGEILWKDTRIGNHPHSSVALDPGNNVMTVGANDGVLYAWDLEEPKFRWTFKTQGAKEANRHQAIKGPIMVYDGGAFFGSWDHNVYRVDLNSGEEDWRFGTDDMIMSGAAVDPNTGTVYIGSHDHNLYALDSQTGDKEWSAETGGWIIGSPTVAGDKVLTGSYDERLHAFDKDTGDKVWDFEANGWITSNPQVYGDRVVFTTRADYQGDDRAGSLYMLEAL